MWRLRCGLRCTVRKHAAQAAHRGACSVSHDNSTRTYRLVSCPRAASVGAGQIVGREGGDSPLPRNPSMSGRADTMV